jgi:hypothetical protein
MAAMLSNLPPMMMIPPLLLISVRITLSRLKSPQPNLSV